MQRVGSTRRACHPDQTTLEIKGRLRVDRGRVLFLVDEDAFIEEILVLGSKATL